MFSIAICDDSKNICTTIENIILNNTNRFYEKIEVEVYNTAAQLFSQLKSGVRYDLIFLDVEIPDMTGIELSNNIRNYLDDFYTKIVFISKSEMYYKELFDVQPMHFLLKPVSKELVLKDVALAIKLCKRNSDKFEYSIAKTSYKLPVEDIMYVVSEGRKMVLTTSDDCMKFYSTIDEVCKQLNKKQFLRIHRAFVVNYNYIKKINADTVVMLDDAEFSIGRTYKQDVKTRVAKIEKELLQ